MRNKLESNRQSDKTYMSQVISALSHALDLTEDQPLGHCIRCCWIGLNIAMQLNYTKDQLVDLYYTVLLKDPGCSSNASRLYEIFGADGKGYPKGLKGDEISLETRIITVCAIFHSLIENRPYRKSMTIENALEVMEGMKGKAIDSNCFDILRKKIPTLGILSRV